MTNNIIKVNLPDFITEPFNSQEKYTKVRAGRRTGKTYNAALWIGLKLFRHPNSKGLWVDTTQGNLSRYRDLYFRKIFGESWKTCHIKAQDHDVIFPNGSYLHMRSSQRPELMEGFDYDFAVVNEVFIVLKKERIWENTIQPMLKNENCKVKIIGSPKIETIDEYEELPGKEYHYTTYDSPFWTDNEIEEAKASTDSFSWRLNYMAEKLAESPDALVTKKHLRYWENLPVITKAYMHIDCTHTGKETSDFAACGIIGEGRDRQYYLIDFFIEKLNQQEQARKAILMYLKHADQYNIHKFTFDEKSNQGFGGWLKSMALQEFNLSVPIMPLDYSNDKVTHFMPHVPHFHSGRVFFPIEHKDKKELVKQVVVFPHKDFHDDAVDMLSGLLDNFKKTSGGFINF